MQFKFFTADALIKHNELLQLCCPATILKYLRQYSRNCREFPVLLKRCTVFLLPSNFMEYDLSLIEHDIRSLKSCELTIMISKSRSKRIIVMINESRVFLEIFKNKRLIIILSFILLLFIIFSHQLRALIYQLISNTKDPFTIFKLKFSLDYIFQVPDDTLS